MFGFYYQDGIASVADGVPLKVERAMAKAKRTTVTRPKATPARTTIGHGREAGRLLRIGKKSKDLLIKK